MSGCAFDRMLLRDTLLSDCALRYASFSDSKLERCEWSGCDLSESMLFGIKPKQWSIARCKLNGAQLRECSLAGVNLSDSEIENISASAEALRGVTVSILQAPEVLSLFGVHILA